MMHSHDTFLPQIDTQHQRQQHLDQKSTPAHKCEARATKAKIFRFQQNDDCKQYMQKSSSISPICSSTSSASSTSSSITTTSSSSPLIEIGTSSRKFARHCCASSKNTTKTRDTLTPSTTATGATSNNKPTDDPTNGGCLVLLNLPPVVTNSALVHQRASAKDILAAATVTTGASLPLMIGGRSKCVLNLVELAPTDTQQQQNGRCGAVCASPQQSTPAAANGPQNTALRAEQRKRSQNMVSVVRPVVNTTMNNSGQQQQLASSPPATIKTTTTIEQPAPIPRTTTTAVASSKVSSRLEDSVLWTTQVFGSKQRNGDTGSLIDELMSFDKRLASMLPYSGLGAGGDTLQLDDLLQPEYRFQQQQQPHQSMPMQMQMQMQMQMYHQAASEQQLRQQMAAYRREQHELNRNIKRQHKFIVNKIEERKRNLQIIQSIWVHKDFKHAIEKLVDIYHQGLVFAPASLVGPGLAGDDINSKHHSAARTTNTTATTTNTSQASNNYCPDRSQLCSLNSSLVVDVISVIVLRPKLWNLEICQLLLPIIINDLLMHKTTTYEYYIDVAIKSVRLILTHFSSVIKSTLDSQKDANKLLNGVDLSREDRVNKCLGCYRLLMEARAVVARRVSSMSVGAGAGEAVSMNAKLASLCKELEQCFAGSQCC